MIQAKSQAVLVSEVLDPNYIPLGADVIELFKWQNAFIPFIYICC
jgi:hypothetical protein